MVKYVELDMVLQGCTDPRAVSDAATEAIRNPGEAVLLPTGAKLTYQRGSWHVAEGFRVVGYACDGSDLERLWPGIV